MMKTHTSTHTHANFFTFFFHQTNQFDDADDYYYG